MRSAPAKIEAARTAAAEARAAQAEQERQEQRAGRICEECGGGIPARVKLDAVYCGKACRDAAGKRRKKESYDANRQALLEQDRAYRLANPRQGSLAAARQRAARLGVPFELTGADLPEELGDCVICARELAVGTRKVTPASPTIDRVRPALGYVPGNVLAWVCFGCNARKHNKTLYDLADGAAGEHWQSWAHARLGLAARRRVVHRRVA